MISLAQTNFFSEAQIKVLNRRGLRNIRDLLFYLPRRYIDRTKILDLRTTRLGDTVTFIGKIVQCEVVYGRKRRLVAQVEYQNFIVDLVFFQGIPYFSKILSPGTVAAFSGVIESFRGHFSMLHPEIEILSGDESLHTGKIIPLYKITEAMKTAFLSSRVLREAIHGILKKYGKLIQDHLSEKTALSKGIIELSRALQLVHFPNTMEDVEIARRRLAFDELLYFAAMMIDRTEARKKIKKEFSLKDISPDLSISNKLIVSLPFALTADQKKAISYLGQLAQEGYPFGALLQGDVGSGKTLVALLHALRYIESDIQVALMAPTEILARQHFQTFRNLLTDFPFLQMDLLLGAEKASERRAKLDRIARGDTSLIIGTHSLIQNDVKFRSLGLVIIDEQHRFGVEQREALRAKGITPDILAMTATPIPRSLTLALYGDLEQIIIREKPAGRKPVDTRMFAESDLPKIYRAIEKYLDMGRQAYIVYPMIDENEAGNWASLMSDYELLEKKIFPTRRLGLLHGRLSSDEKDRAMQKFKEGLIQILVTTTVVEVGVDVPNATVMVIRNAERFGLSQLHQLRGRVGRGEHQSFCILVPSARITGEGEERLKAMLESEDGFYLAQKDFEIRGTGELTGLRQAGVSEFHIADLRVHGDLAAEARDLLLSDPELRSKITAAKNWQKELQKGMILFAN